MKVAKVIDPAAQEDRGRVWFGATVTIADEDDDQRTVSLVGDDESNATAGQIGWSAPIARALRGAAIGDLRKVTLPGGEREYEIVAITYPNAALASATTSGSASTGFIDTPASSRSAT